jgi:hypothetical protein
MIRCTVREFHSSHDAFAGDDRADLRLERFRGTFHGRTDGGFLILARRHHSEQFNELLSRQPTI